MTIQWKSLYSDWILPIFAVVKSAVTKDLDRQSDTFDDLVTIAVHFLAFIPLLTLGATTGLLVLSKNGMRARPSAMGSASSCRGSSGATSTGSARS